MYSGPGGVTVQAHMALEHLAGRLQMMSSVHVGFAVAIRAAWPWKRMDRRGPGANRALSELASGKVEGLVVHGMLSDRPRPRGRVQGV